MQTMTESEKLIINVIPRVLSGSSPLDLERGLWERGGMLISRAHTDWLLELPRKRVLVDFGPGFGFWCRFWVWMSSVLQKMPELVGSKEEKETRRKRKDSKPSGKSSVSSENAELTNGLDQPPEEKPSVSHDFGPQLKIIKMNDQVRELQTILRDKWVLFLSVFPFYWAKAS